MKFEVEFPESLENQLRQMANIDGLADEMLQAAAPVAVDAIRQQVQRYNRTGALARSVKASKPKKRKGGGRYISVGFSGYDKSQAGTKAYPKGVPNAVKAAGLEYGNAHGETAKPFMKAAENSCKDAVAARMQDVFEKRVGTK